MSDHSEQYNKLLPRDSDLVSAGAEAVRSVRAGVSERLLEDHNWNTNITEGDPDQDGAHKKITLNDGGKPDSGIDDCGIVFAKDVSGTNELFYMDEDDNEVQITDNGKVSNTFHYFFLTASSEGWISYPTGFTDDNCSIVAMTYYESGIGHITLDTQFLAVGDGYMCLPYMNNLRIIGRPGTTHRILFRRF